MTHIGLAHGKVYLLTEQVKRNSKIFIYPYRGKNVIQNVENGKVILGKKQIKICVGKNKYVYLRYRNRAVPVRLGFSSNKT